MLKAMNAGALLFIAAAASLPAQAPARPAAPGGATLTGTWRSDAPIGWTLVLQVDGNAVTGAVNVCSSSPSVEIADARIDGKAISFKCTSADGDRTLVFSGTHRPDEITLTWELQVRPGGKPLDAFDSFNVANPNARFIMPRTFTLKRASAGLGAVLLDRIAERRRTTKAPFSPVTFERILHADKEPQNWLTYSRTLNGQRHSPLMEINTSNVAQLELAWIWPSRATGRFQATPLVVDGVLYTVEAPNNVVALDAQTGTVLWMYSYTPAKGARATGGGGFPNRGVAILDDTLFMGTLDAHLLAIDARTGKVMWNITVADFADSACKIPDSPFSPCYAFTHAPLVVKDKVIIGTSGGDGDFAGHGIRGFIAAFDAKTGREAWRRYTIPAPGEPGNDTWSGDSWKTGGAGAWITGSYDPDLNLIYWGTGNPIPTNDGHARLGDNLYSNSVLALDGDTGALKWHYQFTPHDDMDWDSAHVPVLADVQWLGRTRKALLTANKNGLLYAIDRATGDFLYAKPYVELNWVEGFTANGRPIVTQKPKSEWIPRRISGTNWHPPSYSPKTGFFYVSSRERADDGPGNSHGDIQAFDSRTGERRWTFTRKDTWYNSGILTTASDLLFAGSTGDFYSGPTAERRENGYFVALDARTGKLLWETSLAGAVHSTPMTYSVAGMQYVAVTGGNNLFVFAIRR
jgi:alcohol dehydrogenase (cytochrome c)